MARAVVFKTDGLIDIKAFTHFGVNSKPKSESPIGYFGTGLKYAIAVLCREGLRPVVWIGPTKYTFKAKLKKFRDKEFNFIVMVRETKVSSLGDLWQKREIELPITTEVGKNWVLWQAFRELEANTRDEDGKTYLADSTDVVMFGNPFNGSTLIIVEGEKFVQEYLEREKTFLPEGLHLQVGTSGLQVFDRPSKHIYYRGLRVYDFGRDEHSELTYNFLSEQELTEDRTLKDPYSAQAEIKRWVAQHASKEQVTKALNAPSTSMEGRLDYSYVYASPSSAFIESAQSSPKSSAKRLVQQWGPKGAIEDPFKGHPRPWKVVFWAVRADYPMTILDANDQQIPEELAQMGMRIINAYDYPNLDHHVIPKTTNTTTSPDEEYLDVPANPS